MQIRQQTFTLPPFPQQDGDTLYFDIETTGLSAANSSLYLIGCCFFDGRDWQLVQWFGESMSDEAALLRAFFGELPRFSRLVHYNGTGFDIPYLKNCARQYRIPHRFGQIESLDLFRTARHLNRILGLENYRQKTVEQFFDLGRQDKKSGGELIGQYLAYMESRDETLLPELLLHNAEDVANLPRLHAALSAYDSLTDAAYLLSRRATDDQLTLTLTLPGRHFPKPIGTAAGCVSFRLEVDSLTIGLPLVKGELKHFFSDYRDYWYLPEEDIAIHQKVAQFVDRTRRVRATAATCYTKSSGCFFEQPAAILTPDFQETYRGKTPFCASSGRTSHRCRALFAHRLPAVPSLSVNRFRSILPRPHQTDTDSRPSRTHQSAPGLLPGYPAASASHRPVPHRHLP